jgi:hypothetical protein
MACPAFSRPCRSFTFIGASSFQESDINACKNAPFRSQFTTLACLEIVRKVTGLHLYPPISPTNPHIPCSRCLPDNIV